jgi:AMP-binding enzyme
MILGQASPQNAAMLAKGARSTFDDLFRRAAARRPDAIALVDPPDRASITDGEPRRLTYAQADRAIAAVAERLRRLGLQTDQIVGFQMANTVDAVVTLLGILRAGLIAMPLPLLWRQADCVAALNRVSARALIVSGRIGSVDHCMLAMHVAADVFSIRQVGAFGRNVPDGVTPFDDLYEVEASDDSAAVSRALNPAAHLAIITWDVCPDGLVPVARSHFEVLAAGAAVTLESRIEHNATILTSLALPSLAGLALAVVPWLLVGGTLALHHPFDDMAFLQQCRNEQCNFVVLPGALALRFGDAGALSRRDGIKTVIAAWRAPERLAASAAWGDPVIGLVDVPVFGETGLIATRRGGNGRPAPIPLGQVSSPRGAPGALHVAEIARTRTGTLGMRGPLVPKFALASDVDSVGKPVFAIGPEGFADTGYPCTVDQTTRAVAIAGAPAGIVNVGGYRFGLRTLADMAAAAEPGGGMAVRPDGIGGMRLAGTAADHARVREALALRGVNPLVLEAFGGEPDRDRRTAS